MDVVLLDGIASAIRSVAKRTEAMAITADSNLFDDLALDSLDLVGVLMQLEDRFNLTIELDDVPNLQTVAELASHLEKLGSFHANAA